jgi:hypothetical protein
MNNTKIQLNTTCNTGFNEDHLCYMASQGFNLENPIQYNALIDNPDYRCNHCGRHANSQENLCKPEPL